MPGYGITLSNDTFMLIGLDGFVLHMLCERLRVDAPTLYTNIDVVNLRQTFLDHSKRDRIKAIHKRMYTRNYVYAGGFNSR